MSIHSKALDTRALHAESEAYRATNYLIGELLAWLVTDCPPSECVEAARAVATLRWMCKDKSLLASAAPVDISLLTQNAPSARAAYHEWFKLRTEARALRNAADIINNGQP